MAVTWTAARVRPVTAAERWAYWARIRRSLAARPRSAGRTDGRAPRAGASVKATSATIRLARAMYHSVRTRSPGRPASPPAARRSRGHRPAGPGGRARSAVEPRHSPPRVRRWSRRSPLPRSTPTHSPYARDPPRAGQYEGRSGGDRSGDRVANAVGLWSTWQVRRATTPPVVPAHRRDRKSVV